MSILSLVVDAHVDEKTLLNFEREDLKYLFDGNDKLGDILERAISFTQ